MEPTPENIKEAGPKTAKVLRELARQKKKALRAATASPFGNVVQFPPNAQN
jgi:hypothetical protein